MDEPSDHVAQTAYMEGYKAYTNRRLPSACPYLPSVEGVDANGVPVNPELISGWMDGWSDAHADEGDAWGV